MAATDSLKTAYMTQIHADEERRLELIIRESKLALQRLKFRNEAELRQLPLSDPDMASTIESKITEDVPDEAQSVARPEAMPNKPFHDVGYEAAPNGPFNFFGDDAVPKQTVYLRDAPKLDITEFDGKYEEFPFFKAQIMEAIRLQHSEMQVLRHLKERLKGQAFQAVHGALLTGASFEEVWAILEERFGNPQIIIGKTVKKLLNFSQIRDGDIERLQLFSTELSNAIAILRSMGHAEELDSLQIIQKLAAKLPKDSRHEWGLYGRSKVGGGRVTCEFFCAFLRTHVKDRRFCADSDITEDRPRRLESRPASRQKQTAYATTDKIRCFFCDSQHFIQRCEAFKRMAVKERHSNEWQ